MTPRWLSVELVRAIHAEQADMFGGPHGVRDLGLLESALDRPRNLAAYGENVTLPELAAAYCAGIVRNHPFVDGNKRTGYIAAHTFIELNGYVFDPPEAEVVTVIMALAAGKLDDATLAAWFNDYSMRKKS